ncbi:MAG: cytochrome c biogenesis protein CcsA [Polyangiaceae bacterium]
MSATTKPNNRYLGMVALLALTAIACVGTIEFVFLRVPNEATMGIVQKILYFHAPAATAMYLGAGLCFIGSVGYLLRSSMKWDAFARAGADVTVIMGVMVLISGALWGAKGWGRYWTWDPRLTATLLQVLIYVAYGILRSFAAGGDAERKFAAALGILGAANIPIIKYSVQKWGGQHPTVTGKGGGGLSHPDMRYALLFGFLTFGLITFVFMWQRYKLHYVETEVEGLEQEAIALGLAGD